MRPEAAKTDRAATFESLRSTALEDVYRSVEGTGSRSNRTAGRRLSDRKRVFDATAAGKGKDGTLPDVEASAGWGIMGIGCARLALELVLLAGEAQRQLVTRASIDLRLSGGATGVRSARLESTSTAEYIGAGTTFGVACE